MFVTARAKKIIELLIEAADFIRIDELARALQTTQRTIYRDMIEVNPILKEYQLAIQNKEGKGIRIVGNITAIKKLSEMLQREKVDDVLSKQDRISLVVLTLLQENRYVKTQEFALNLNVSLQTIRSDLKDVKRFIQENSLDLITKKGSGIRLIGNEIHIRQLIVRILLERVKLEKLFTYFSGRELAYNEYLAVLDTYEYPQVIRQVFQMSKHRIAKYNHDASSAEFVLLLSLLILRHDYLDERGYYSIEKQAHSNKEKALVDVFKKTIEITFGIRLYEVEHEYLKWLIGLNVYIKNHDTTLSFHEYQLIDKVQEFVQSVEATLGIQIYNDESLLHGLLSHMERAFARVQNKLFLSNPMKDEIKKDYRDLYYAIKDSFEEIFHFLQFSEDELAYLVLYFVVAINQIMTKSANVLVICTSGMGSSKLLANRLEKEIDEIKVKKTISLVGLWKENIEEYDLVLSTVPIDMKSEKILIVSPLLTQQEIVQIKETIHKRRNHILHRNLELREQREDTSTKILDELHQSKILCEWGIDLIENFSVIQLDVSLNTDVIHEIERYLIDHQLIHYDGKQTRLGLANKQQLFEIPETKLIYFEFCSSSIQSPVFLVFTLHKTEHTANINGLRSQADTFILILYPSSSALIQELLSALAISIVDSAYSIDIFEAGDEEKIKQILSSKIKQHLYKQL